MSEEIKKTEEKIGNETNDTTVSTTTKKSTWLNRICSAVVGAVVAVGTMFGITQPQIDAQKAKVVEIKTYATTALDALKNGDITTATEKLQQATASTKEVAEQIKKDVEKVKKADKQSVVETAKNAATEALVKDQVKKIETAEHQYNNKITKVKKSTTSKKPVVKKVKSTELTIKTQTTK